MLKMMPDLVRKTGKVKEVSSVEAKIELIDRAKADRYLQVGKYKYQRNISDTHVKSIMNAMEAGTFKPTSNPALAWVKDQFYTINGRHTLTSIVRSGLAQTLPVTHYYCKNMQEVGELYATLDIGRKRTPAARLSALGVIEKFGTGATETSAINAAMKLIFMEFGRVGSKSDQAISIRNDANLWADQWKKYDKEITEYIKLLRSVEDRHSAQRMLKGSVAAVAIATLEADLQNWEFWYDVGADDGLSARNPAHALNKWLIGVRPLGGGNRNQQIASATAFAWNAHYDEREIRSVRSSEGPVVILGTRFD